MLASVDVTPFIIVERVLPVEVAADVLMIVDVAILPPILEVSVLVTDVNVFGTEMLPTVRFEIVVVASVEVPDTARVPCDTSEDVAVMFVPVAEPKKKFEIEPVIALKIEVKRFADVVVARDVLPVTERSPPTVVLPTIVAVFAESTVAVVVARVEVPTTLSP
jgi:hypothetical protein